ncbi:hypothetical protein PPGU19_033990 [Paraburkholderia sp. PGU19]|uniref:spermidine synthase n=1 Tax=Paraburkholderia sp. PGU19 TaxID=2735434 RepID=UPI0015DB99E9|nr:methyltransferase [Paraburkholderia sp. PGU19]BCF98830.1 hypothetical protein PPGU19_033990 [Paraburkholderia sp. PGU19]
MKTVFETTTVRIIETSDAEGDTQRQLYLGPPFSSIQGAIKVNKPKFHVHDFTKKLTYGALCVRNGVHDALVLGLGAGVVIQSIRDFAPSVKIDIVDVNLELFEASHKFFFDLDSDNIQLFHEDAYHFVDRANKKYDYICCDIFGSSLEVPNYVLSGELAGKVKHCLSAEGIFAINTHRQLHKSLVESLSKSFEFVFSLPGNNCLLLCSDVWPQFVADDALIAQQLQNNVDIASIHHDMTLTQRVDIQAQPKTASA